MSATIKGQILSTLTVLVLVIFPCITKGAAPSLISFQGFLTDAGGNPVSDGNYSVTFKMYDAPSGGSLLWVETQNVTAEGGVFSTLLGSINPITKALFTSDTRYLAIQVGSDPEQVPRTRIVSSPYALTAVEADSIPWSGIRNTPAGFADGVDDVGTGDVSLSADQTFTGTNRFDGIVEFGDSTMRVGNDNVSIGTQFLLGGPRALDVYRDYNSTSLRQLVNISATNSNTGQLTGLWSIARQELPDGAGAELVAGIEGLGVSDAGPRIGVRGYATPDSPAIGSGSSYGVFGEGKYGFYAHGIKGDGFSAEFGYGLYGTARHNFHSGYATLSRADSNDVFGYGIHTRARGNGSAGFGVYAQAADNGNSSYGVYGRATGNTDTGYGVYGYANGNSVADWAGYFSGDVRVTGNVISPANLSTIDHPTDPSNKYLQHSAVESAEMIRSYSGNVILDDNGEAVVLLPQWFEQVNRDYRYQLTCVGGYAPVYVSREIENGAFAVAGGNPGLMVSWEVKALRDDAYARSNPLVVEMEKLPNERGKYLHPETLGVAEELGIDFEKNRLPTQPVDK